MNKAFVREPDQTDQGHCPRCGSLGVPVHRETLEAHLEPEALRTLAESAFFCPFPKCQIAYFDMFDRAVTVDQLLHPVYPKDPQAPVRACFGMTAEEIERDAQAGDVTRVRALVQKAKTPEATCTVKSASGQSCVPEIQRYYMRALSSK